MKRAVLLSSVLAFCGVLLLASWLMLNEAAGPPSIRLAARASGGIRESGGFTPGYASGAPSGRTAPEGQRRASGGFTPVGGIAPTSGGLTPGYASGAPSGRTAPKGQGTLAGGETPGLPDTPHVPAGGGRRAPLPDEITKQVRLDQKLNAQVPLDLKFRDETGKLVPLHQFFGRQPVMMNLIQYRCTMLCSEEMNVLGQSLKELEFSAGDQFNMLTVSIDARETPALATAYKQGYLDQYRRPTAAAGWHFLTGDVATIRRLADAIGYHFVYDARTDQFAHPDGVIVVTPKGRVARYFFRLEYPPRDLRLALVEAAAQKIGSPLDYVALLCYHYNPVTGKYSLALMNVLRLAAVATLLFVGMGVATMTMWDRRRKSARSSELGARSDSKSLFTEPRAPSPEQER